MNIFKDTMSEMTYKQIEKLVEQDANNKKEIESKSFPTKWISLCQVTGSISKW